MVSFCKVFGTLQFVTETNSIFQWLNQEVFSKTRHFLFGATPPPPMNNDWPLKNTQDEKSDLQYSFNAVPKCKCREGQKIAIVQICVQI